MTELNQAAYERALLLKELSNRVAKAITDNKRHLQDLPEGTTLRIKLEGEVVGSVAMTVGSRSIIVTDEPEFVDWCDEFHPDEVEVITRVRPSFIEHGLVMIDDAVIDRQGNIVPGVAVRTGTGYPAVKPAKDKGDVLWAAVRSRVLELTSGTDDD
jgi:hypothetical protein